MEYQIWEQFTEHVKRQVSDPFTFCSPSYLISVVLYFTILLANLQYPPSLVNKMATPYQKMFLEVIRSGDSNRLRSMLEERQFKVNINIFNPEGQTALHQSCVDGNLELVKLLLAWGADARLANRDGWSALHIAVYGGHRDIVRYLLTGHERK